LLDVITKFLGDFINLFVPSKCLNCGINLYKNEKYVCKGCLSKIPRTNFHKDINNPVSQLFWGRLKLENAYSFSYYTKGGILQGLIHEIKYHGGKELASELGTEFARDLKRSGFPDKYDYICPVPLHKQRQKHRGYNQSEWLAKGMSEILKTPVETKILRRKVFTNTQTKKNREQRWENVKDAFEVIDQDKIKNKHILLLDDVITTGATLEACARELLEVEGTKVSVASLACALD
jgi:ComF family protein